MLLETTDDERELSPERAWWLRVPAVLLSPRAVFYALREEDPDDVAARSEPILLVIWLAGAAGVLTSFTAGRLLDDPQRDALVVAIWTFVFGGIYGAAGYLIIGFAIHFGARLFGSLGSFRRERHIVAFAAVPMALSFFLLLPVQLALYGDDVFRSGGSDHGAGPTVVDVVQVGFALWALGLLLLGVRVVHGWSWPRTVATVAAGVALLAAVVGVVAFTLG